MDKISAALICGIMILMCISGTIVYNTWIRDEGGIQSDAAELVGLSSLNKAFIFHDDTSMTNNSVCTLWVRVRVVSHAENEEMEIISRYINENCWQTGGDGWYYYGQPLEFARTTKPFAEEIRYTDTKGADVKANGEDLIDDYSLNGSFDLQVEAVDEAWLIRKPISCQDAFELYER